MSVPQNLYTGNGATVLFSFTFPYLEDTDVKASIDGVDTTEYTLDNATTVRFNTAPANGAKVRIYRRTENEQMIATFYPGSAIRSQDLNDDFSQVLYVAQESSLTADNAQLDVDAAIQAANQAVQTAEAAETAADLATATANSASSNASTAVNTANSAVNTAGSAVSTANSAVSIAQDADSKADAAIAAVVSSVNYIAIANVGSIPGSPTNNTYIEVLDSTGLESFTPLAGMPVGFVGDSGLRVRMRYTSSGSTWNWIDYAAKDPEGRYIRQTSISTSTSSSSTTTVASSSAVKAAKDAADAAQVTASAALPKAGGTMTGEITFAGGQAFPGAVTSVSGTAPVSVTAGTTPTVSVGAASTSAAGVVQLSTSTSSTSTTQAATPSAVKSVQDFAQVVSTTANAAMPKAGGTFTGDIVVPSINSGPLAGFRNAIINGNFDVWQRGTSQTSPGYGSADRWTLVGATGTISFSRQPFTIGQTSVPGNPTYFARYQVTVAPGSSNLNMSQRIEGVSNFAGQQITVSFWAKADAAKSIWVGHFQNFGTGGSPSATVNTPGQVITLSTSWTRYSVTTTLPSISGKTLGSDGNDYVTLHFIVSNATAGVDWSAVPAQTITFDIAQVQVEAGPVATPFERRPIGAELALCQRYYFSVAPAAGVIVRQRNYASTTSEANFTYAWPVVMRSAPSVVATGDINDGSSFSTWDGLIATDRYLYLNKTGLLTFQWCDFSGVTASAEL